MTTNETDTAAREAADIEAEYQQLSTELLRNTKIRRHRAAVQALIEERTILSLPAVQRALIVDSRKGRSAQLAGLSGLQYSLGLDEGQRTFLGLVLSLVGMGITTLAAVQDLDERRLPIILRAILRLAGNEDLAIGRRL
ncbi:hypothetical protein QNO09_12875 [Streptomyces sp. 378]|uniref:hypothetical protein n=1 Tax=Streptomyces sp. 378 TaxID=3049412 RepID=UPI0024C21F17|nr:hypothetical protein [Streptomyces sp. 378]MDK1344180.1 hypothetical protein [Streptomyces sp. 378]